MVELVYGHLNDATSQRVIEQLPAAAAAVPSLAVPGTSSADPTKPRRRFGAVTDVAPPARWLVGEELAPCTCTG